MRLFISPWLVYTFVQVCTLFSRTLAAGLLSISSLFAEILFDQAPFPSDRREGNKRPFLSLSIYCLSLSKCCLAIFPTRESLEGKMQKCKKRFFFIELSFSFSALTQIIFGFSPSRDEYGMMMYHRNRLIKAFERVGCQKEVCPPQMASLEGTN